MKFDKFTVGRKQHKTNQTTDVREKEAISNTKKCPLFELMWLTATVINSCNNTLTQHTTKQHSVTLTTVGKLTKETQTGWEHKTSKIKILAETCLWLQRKAKINKGICYPTIIRDFSLVLVFGLTNFLSFQRKKQQFKRKCLRDNFR